MAKEWWENDSVVTADPDQWWANDAVAKPPAADPGRTLLGTLQDVGVTALKGAVGLPQAAVGIADILTLGRAGKALESVGYRPAEAQATLETMFSPAQQAANRKVQQADGFLETAKAALQNPSTIAVAAGESLPQMLAGGAVARGVTALAPKVAPWLAAGIGEGVMGAGSAASQTREQNPDRVLTPTQAAAAVGSGVGTAAFGAAGNKLAGKLGVGDIDTMLAGGKLAKSPKGFVRQVLEAGVSEGAFEELPQSVQEQMWSNFATGKPLGEGVGNAAAMGLITGAAMGGAGGGFNAASSSMRPQPADVAASELATALETTQAPPVPDRATLVAQERAKLETLRAASIARIGEASTVDEAIQAAHAAVGVPAQGPVETESIRQDRELLAQASQATDATAEAAAPAAAPPAAAEVVDEVPTSVEVMEDRLQLKAMLTRNGQRIAETERAIQQINGASRRLRPGSPADLERQQLIAELQTLKDNRLAYQSALKPRKAAAPEAVAPLATEPPPAVIEQAPPAASLMGRPVAELQTGQLLQVAKSAMFPEPVREVARQEVKRREIEAMYAQRAVTPQAKAAEEQAIVEAVRDERVEQAEALTSAQTVDAPTAMQLAFQRAQAQKAPTQPKVAHVQDPASAPTATQAGTPAAPTETAAPARADGAAPARVSQPGAAAGVEADGVALAPSPIEGRDLGDGWAEFSPESGTKGVPRAQMPQIKAAHRGAMVNFMNARGVAHHEETVPAGDLKPTQAEFSREKVARAAASGDSDRSILVSQDGHVLDGHHQWMAARERGEPVKVIRLDAPIDSLIELAHEFPSSTVSHATVDAASINQAHQGGNEGAPAAKWGDASASAEGADLTSTRSAGTGESVPDEKSNGNQAGRYSRGSPDGDIQMVVDSARQPGHAPQKAYLGEVSPWLAESAAQVGLQIDGFRHVLDGSAVRHTIKNHYDEKAERSRGQVPVTDADLLALPDVINEPDRVIFGTTNRLNRDQVGFVKKMPDGSVLYLEEIRTGRKELAAVSMRKYPATMNVDAVAATLHPNARGDGGNGPIVLTPPAVGNEGEAYSRPLDAETVRKLLTPMPARMSVGQVQAEVDAVSKTWKSAPPIRVVDTVADLPFRNPPANARGAYDGRTIWVVAVNHRSPATLRRTIAHEAVAHAGLRGMLGEQDFEKLLRTVKVALQSKNKALMEIQADVRRIYVDDKGNFNLSEQSEMDEIIARATEEAVDLSTGTIKDGFGAFKTIYSRIAEWLRNVVGLKVPFSMTELHGFLLRSEEYLNTAPQPQDRQLDQESAPVMASDEDGVDFARGGAVDPSSDAPPEETFRRKFQRTVQDQYARFNAVREWAQSIGVDLSPESDVWAAEERMHGRTATRIEDFREKTIQPLVKKIQDAGFSMSKVAEFLHAQHAEERNQQIARINPGMDDGSGMTTEEARAIIKGAPAGLKDLANELQAVTDRTRSILLESGLISQEMAEAWTGAYQRYVPLKGGDEKVQTGTGKGLSVKSTQKRALGHGARDEHIVENILRDHERAIIASEKNLVGKSLLRMAIELGREDILTVNKPELRRVLKNHTDYEVRAKGGESVGIFDSQAAAAQFIASQGQAGLTMHPVRGDPVVTAMASPMLAENEVQVYVLGHAIRMQLNDPLLARAYKRLGVEELNRWMAVNREINAFLSRMYTGLNVEFLAVNVMRDFTSGLANITGQHGAGIAAKAIKHYPKAFGNLLRYAFSKGERVSEDLQAYRDAGGTTGASWLSDIERIGQDVQSSYDEYQGVVSLASEKKHAAAIRTALRKSIKATTRWIENLNAAGENAMRLAVFNAIRDDGGTTEKAASAAKNATVNFNRRGELGQYAGALYLFANPAIQGSAVTLDALFKSKHKRQAQAVAAMLGGMAYMLAASQFGGADDEDEWRAIPDHVRDKNIVIRTGEKSYITLPVPYGMGYFFQLGNAIFDLQRGEDKAKIALRLTAGLLENFGPAVNPLGGDDAEASGLVEMVPGIFGGELMRAAARMAVNRSGLGGQIVPGSKFDEDKPDNQRMWRSTRGSPYEKATTWLNEATGGTPSQAGFIDVSPETLKFWTSTLTGGTGKSIVDTYALGDRKVRRSLATPGSDDEAGLTSEVSEIPIARKFYRKEDIRDLRRVYWEDVKAVREAVKDLNRAVTLMDLKGFDKVMDSRGYLIALGDVAEATGEMVKDRRDVIDAIMQEESFTLGERRLHVKEMEAQERAVYEDFTAFFAIQKRESAAAK